MPRSRSGDLLTALALPAEGLAQAAAIVRRRTGLAFDPARRPLLEAGIRSAMTRSGVPSLEAYLGRLESDAELLDGLVTEITVGETYFFRDRDQFALLREQILPELLRTKPAGRPLRIWCAGCATGEEPYSLAILMHQFGLLAEVAILGTDISRVALRHARQGRYTSWSLRGVSDEVIGRYFTRTGNRVTLRPELRDAVDFRHLNLADDRYPSVQSGAWEMDLILCRNVLIYIAADRIPEIATRLVASLADSGWLLLGSADPLLTGMTSARAEITPAGLVYRHGPAPRSEEVPWVAARPPVAATTALDLPPLSIPVPIDPRKPSDRTNDSAKSAAAIHAADAARWYTTGEYDRAADGARAALAQGAESVEIWMLLINALVNDRALEAAQQACRTAREHHVESAELAALHAFVLIEVGNQREAEIAARQAAYLDPSLPQAHLAVGATLLVRRDTSGAHRAFHYAERLAAGSPGNSDQGSV